MLGVKESSARITEITDTATGLKDGTLTIGDKLKVDESDAAQGVFFKAANGTEYKSERRLSVNKMGQIIARIPDTVPEGEVTVTVRTKYSGSSAPLKTLREIVFKLPCTAKR